MPTLKGPIIIRIDPAEDGYTLSFSNQSVRPVASGKQIANTLDIAKTKIADFIQTIQEPVTPIAATTTPAASTQGGT